MKTLGNTKQFGCKVREIVNEPMHSLEIHDRLIEKGYHVKSPHSVRQRLNDITPKYVQRKDIGGKMIYYPAKWKA